MNLERVFCLIVIADVFSVTVAGRRRRNSCKCGIESGGRSMNPICGNFEDKEMIVNGDEVRPSYRYPWMAAVIRRGSNACGAALISRDYVITAAHCVVRGRQTGYINTEECYDQDNVVTKCFYEADELEVAFTTKTYEMSRYYKVEQVIVHPNYKVDNYEYDMVLLKLRRPVRCSRTRRPICLPHDASVIRPGTKVVAAGWGIFQPGGEGHKSKKLLHTWMQIYTKRRCRKETLVQTESLICAVGVGDQGICFGDSGSPVFHSQGGVHYLSAVVSAVATGKCETNTPAFFTPVPANLKWISKYVNGEK